MVISVGHGLFTSYFLNYKRHTTILVSIFLQSHLSSLVTFSQKFQNRNILIIKDATSSDFNLNTKFDLSICCEVLEHVKDPLRLLLNIKNNLKETGVLFISTVSDLEVIDRPYLPLPKF